MKRLTSQLVFFTILWLSIPPSICSPAVVAAPKGSGFGSHRLRSRRLKQYQEKCKAGKEYNITSVDNLKGNLRDLQCIFWAAEEPTKVPEGPYYGDVLNFGNVEFLNPILKKFWTGKFVERINCQGNSTFLGWNRVMSQPHFPFVAYLGRIPDHTNTHPQHRNNKTSLMIDYRTDLSTVCPDFVKMEGRNFDSISVRKSPMHKNFHPINAILDVARFVGRQKDGGAIFLGQLFGEDKFATGKISKPLCFFSLVIYDPELNKEFKYGQTLKPLESDLYYDSQSFLDPVMLTLSVDNILSEPIHALKMMALEVVPAVGDVLNFIWDSCCASGEDADRLTEKFKKLQSNSPIFTEVSKFKLISESEGFHSHLNEL